MNTDYLKFLNKERLKAKEELDSARIRLNLIMFEEFKCRKDLVANEIGGLLISKSAASYMFTEDEEEKAARKKSLATYISDMFNIKYVKVLTVHQFGFDARSHCIRFSFGRKKELYEIEVPNLNSSYWTHDTLPSKMDTDKILDLIYYMDIRVRSVRASNGPSYVCDEITSFLKDPDGYRSVFNKTE